MASIGGNEYSSMRIRKGDKSRIEVIEKKEAIPQIDVITKALDSLKKKGR